MYFYFLTSLFIVVTCFNDFPVYSLTYDTFGIIIVVVI